MNKRELIYRIDANGIITSVNAAWDEFAAENDCAGLAQRALGTPLRNHIVGEEVWHLYSVLFQRIRDRGTTAHIPFRCDSPGAKRYMSLLMLPLADGSIEFHSRTERIVRYDTPIALLDRSTLRNDSFVIMCAWCKRVKVGPETWAELEDAVRILGLFDAPACPSISHGICDACTEIVLSA